MNGRLRLWGSIFIDLDALSPIHIKMEKVIFFIRSYDMNPKIFDIDNPMVMAVGNGILMEFTRFFIGYLSF